MTRFSRRRIFGLLAGLAALGTARATAAAPAPVDRIVNEMRRNGAEAGSASDFADAISEREAVRRIAEINEWVAAEMRQGLRPADEIAAEAASRFEAVIGHRHHRYASGGQGQAGGALQPGPQWSAKR